MTSRFIPPARSPSSPADRPAKRNKISYWVSLSPRLQIYSITIIGRFDSKMRIFALRRFPWKLSDATVRRRGSPTKWPDLPSFFSSVPFCFLIKGISQFRWAFSQVTKNNVHDFRGGNFRRNSFRPHHHVGSVRGSFHDGISHGTFRCRGRRRRSRAMQSNNQRLDDDWNFTLGRTSFCYFKFILAKRLSTEIWFLFYVKRTRITLSGSRFFLFCLGR